MVHQIWLNINIVTSGDTSSFWERKASIAVGNVKGMA